MSTKTKGDILAGRIEKLNASIKNSLWPSGPIIQKALTSALEEYRKPWTLGRSVNGFTLGDGQEWHRQDFTEDMLPEGWRPLIKGEKGENTDKFQSDVTGNWEYIDDSFYASEFLSPRRTRRPLPSVIDPYAELKVAFKAGKTIQVKIDSGWSSIQGEPSFKAPLEEYRIKPAPKLVPLGPEDAPPGSAFRHPLWPDFEYIIPSFVSEDGIYARLGDDDSVNWSWEYMQKERVSISRDGGETWRKCEKEST